MRPANHKTGLSALVRHCATLPYCVAVSASAVPQPYDVWLVSLGLCDMLPALDGVEII